MKVMSQESFGQLQKEPPRCFKCQRIMSLANAHYSDDRADVSYQCPDCKAVTNTGSSRAVSRSYTSGEVGEALRDDHADVPSPVPAICLFGCDKMPRVLGKLKSRLTPARYAVIQALIDAGVAGLRKKELEDRSGKADAVKHLRHIRNLDEDWRRAILMAGHAWKGYRVLHQ